MKNTLLIITIAVFVATPCFAQWSGEASPPILAFGVHDTNLFASVDNRSYPWNLVYRISPFVPRTWTGADAGIDPSQGLVTSFASMGNYFFAGQTFTSGPNDGLNAGEYRSTNDGVSWNTPQIGSPVIADSSFLFGGWGDVAIARSPDSGSKEWDSLTNLSVKSFAVLGTVLFVNSSTGVWKSADFGKGWSQVHPLIIGSITPMDSILFIAGNGQLAKSTDSGSSWSMVTVDSAGVPWYLNVLATDGKNLFAGTKNGILVSTDTGHSWQPQNDGIVDEWKNNSISVTAITVFDTLVFIDVTSSRTTGTYYALYDRPISELTAKSSVVERIVPVDSIEVYPNPILSPVSIRSGGTAVLGVRVLNVLGETVLSIPYSYSSDISFDLSKLPSGTYFLQIATTTGTIVRKIVKE
ncbi:MAG: T9SS type A sorting domain-containing protein [Candidatus Kapaibacterium sp.]